ncbi:MAG: TPM domain-containing protein [Muribaculaceae bacterium]
MALTSFLSKPHQALIVKAIGEAENATSGEIRVHIEPKCKVEDPYQRAIAVFNKLKMYETQQRNGVLIYIAYKSHHFAIIGDQGINEKVPAGFWDEEKEILAKHLASGDVAKGLCLIIKNIGENLKSYFPHFTNDVNEQSNEISYED